MTSVMQNNDIVAQKKNKSTIFAVEMTYLVDEGFKLSQVGISCLSGRFSGPPCIRLSSSCTFRGIW